MWIADSTLRNGLPQDATTGIGTRGGTMLGTFTLLYLIAGSVTALVTMRVFPPMEGFRPGLSLLLLAFIVFALLWPVLVLLAIWYRLTSFLQSSEPEEANGEQQSAARMPVTSGVHAQKPR